MDSVPLDAVACIDGVFGGTGSCAKIFNVTPSAVSHWKDEGMFPERLHHLVYLEARSRGCKLPPEFFGYELSDPDEG